jgi:hypothetical protein
MTEKDKIRNSGSVCGDGHPRNVFVPSLQKPSLP